MKEVEELVALAKERNRIVGVTYINMSFAFGAYNVKLEETNPAAKWRFDPTKAGISFAMADVGTHPLFIIEAMIPDMKIKNLMCTRQAFVVGRELEDNAFTIMNLEGSKHVQAGASGMKWLEKCVESADNGSIWVS